MVGVAFHLTRKLQNDSVLSPFRLKKLLSREFHSGGGTLTNTNEREMMHCSFCGKSESQVNRLIGGPGVFICNECVIICHEILADDATNEKNKRT